MRYVTHLHRLLVGVLLTLLTPLVAHASYSDILTSVRATTTPAQADPEVLAFALAALRPGDAALTPERVQQALRGEILSFCRPTTTSSSSAPSDAACLQEMETIRSLVQREMWVRDVGRDLQAIATGQELQEGVLPGADINELLPQSILAIWEVTATETGASITSPTIVSVPELDDAVKKAVTNALTALKPEERVAATWRLLYGVREARGERGSPRPEHEQPEAEANQPGTERQHLFRETPDLEEALLALQAAVLAAVPATDDRPRLFLPISIGSQTLAWVTDDDVGLRFVEALEPVQPSLVSLTDGTAIRGGTFPPAPGEDADPQGHGLCQMPLSSDGFLCRLAEGGPNCAEPTTNSGPLRLGPCTGTGDVRQTLAGPDACRTSVWRDGGFDTTYQCRPELTCESICNDASASANATTQLHAYKKGSSGDPGVVRGCVRNNNLDLPPVYQALRAAVGMSVSCGLPDQIDVSDVVGADQLPDTCCSIAGEMASVACRAMEEDGVLTNDDGSFRKAPDGTPFTLPNCTAALVIDQCSSSCGRTLPAGFRDALFAQAQTNPGNTPTRCEDALEEPRVQRILAAMTHRDELCRADRLTSFPNTIGNLACYANQCLEDSLEFQRLNPGQSPYVTGETIAPFDAWLGPRQTGSGAVDVAPLIPPTLPAYEPGQLLLEFDSALCELVGLPPLTPPALCLLRPLQRALVPLASFALQAADPARQIDQLRVQVEDVQRAATAFGLRRGQEGMRQALRAPVQSLTTTLTEAEAILQTLRDASFTTVSCPIDGTALSSSSAENSDSSDTTTTQP
jgi:hypothetical protein